MPRNRLLSAMKHYSPTGRKNHGRPLKRLMDTCDQNGSISGPTPLQIYDDDDDDLTFSEFYHQPKEIFCDMILSHNAQIQ
jgi:hypothetical protein